LTTEEAACAGRRGPIHCRRRKRGGAEIHGGTERLIHEIDDEFVREADVAGGVLGRAVVTVAGGQGHDGRIGPSTLKKLKGAALMRPSGLSVVTSAMGAA